MLSRILTNEYANKVINIQPQNLVAYWPLFEQSGAVAYDYSRFSAHGMYATGGVVSLGQTGIGDGRTAASFNGTTSYVDVYSASLVQNFNPFEGTLMAWAKVANAGVWTDGAAHQVVNFTTDINNAIDIRKTATNNTVGGVYLAGGVSKSILTAPLNGSLSYYNTTMTWSKSADQFKVYINSVLQSTSTGLGIWGNVIIKGQIGANGSGATLWSGSIAHVALWNTPLTASQILALSIVP